MHSYVPVTLECIAAATAAAFAAVAAAATAAVVAAAVAPWLYTYDYECGVRRVSLCDSCFSPCSQHFRRATARVAMIISPSSLFYPLSAQPPLELHLWHYFEDPYHFSLNCAPTYNKSVTAVLPRISKIHFGKIKSVLFFFLIISLPFRVFAISRELKQLDRDRAISLEFERDENECILIWEQRQDDSYGFRVHVCNVCVSVCVSNALPLSTFLSFSRLTIT